MQSFSVSQMLFWCLVVCIVFTATSASVNFEDCGSAYVLETVNIEGCDLRLPCYVTVGDKIPVNVKFFADFVSRQLNLDVILDINQIQSKTPVTPEPCESLMCPVRTEAITSFTGVMSVPVNMALNQRGYLHWRVNNEQNQQVICYSVMVQTQNYLQKILRHIHDVTAGYGLNREEIEKANKKVYAEFKQYYKNQTNRKY